MGKMTVLNVFPHIKYTEMDWIVSKVLPFFDSLLWRNKQLLIKRVEWKIQGSGFAIYLGDLDQMVSYLSVSVLANNIWRMINVITHIPYLA